ncbi:hypothetical protein E2C01_051347 [Portunus trituberculatus]|uniref:Uncharacterized protein n=1 Tax=Portunus trituberculatus TaxID=210409 RepID=A0A5B7GK25_PORTR|nr:hypothetical protein [Portunus trituberculatus]
MPSLFFNLPNTPSELENVKIFQTQTLLETSGIWPKISHITLLHLSLLYFILMPQLPSHLSLKINSSLKTLPTTPPSVILGLSLHLLLPLTISCLQSKFFIMMFSMPSLA